MYLTYASRKARIYTAKIFLLLNVGLFSLIVLSTLLLAKGPNRVKLLGWICVGFAVSVFAAPLSIIKRVITTKSVEFMPFSLSFFLTLSAVTWFAYGLFTKDIYVAIPNVLGFSFGVAQMVLYIIYRDAKVVIDEEKLPEYAPSNARVGAEPKAAAKGDSEGGEQPKATEEVHAEETKMNDKV